MAVASRFRPEGSRRRRAGFTLIELLVVMTIIAILMGIIVYIFGAAMRAKNERSMKLRLQDLRAAVQLYTTKFTYPPFDVRNFTTNQNAVMVDNMTNPTYIWIRQSGDMLRTQGGNYKFSEGAQPELMDLWDHPIVVKVLDPASPLPPPPRDHLIAPFGTAKVLLYSVGTDGVDQVGAGENDDIGPEGVQRSNK